MTTRLKGLTVAFTHDIREDDAGAVIAAIKMIKGVLDVQPSESTSSDWIAERRAQNDIGAKLFDVLYPKAKP